MGAIFSLFAKPAMQIATSAAPMPGMAAVADLLSVIIVLCETVPQNRHVLSSLSSLAQFILSTGMLLATWLKDVSTCTSL